MIQNISVRRRILQLVRFGGSRIIRHGKFVFEILGVIGVIGALFASLYANHLSRRTLMASQTAWVGIQSISLFKGASGETKITYTLENFSDSPALEVQNMARLGGTHPAEELQYLKDARLDTLMPHESRDSELAVSGTTAQDILDGKADVIITVVYKDIFEIKHTYVAKGRSIDGRLMVVDCTVK